MIDQIFATGTKEWLLANVFHILLWIELITTLVICGMLTVDIIRIRKSIKRPR